MELGKIALAAITLLLGAILIGVLVEQSYPGTHLITVHDEAISVATATLGHNATVRVNFTVANPPTGWRTGECPLTSVAITNYSGTALTETTNWVMDKSTGVFYLINSSTVWTGFAGGTNSTKVTYTYCPTDYNTSSWGRSIMNMIGGFLALLLLGIAIYYLYGFYKEMKLS